MKRLAALLLMLVVAAPSFGATLKPGTYKVNPCPPAVVCPPEKVCAEPVPCPACPTCADCPAPVAVQPGLVRAVPDCPVVAADSGARLAGVGSPASGPRLKVWHKVLIGVGAALVARHVWMEADEYRGGEGDSYVPPPPDCYGRDR